MVGLVVQNLLCNRVQSLLNNFLLFVEAFLFCAFRLFVLACLFLHLFIFVFIFQKHFGSRKCAIINLVMLFGCCGEHALNNKESMTEVRKHPEY